MTKKFFTGSSFERIYIDMLKEIDKNPEFTPNPRGIGSKEITNLSFELTNPYDRIVWNSARNMNYEFGMKFFIWMINGSSDFSYVSGSNANAEKFANTNSGGLPTNFSTAYGPRIVRQKDAILAELIRDKDSRRAVIHVLEEDDQKMLGIQTKEEYPCTDSIALLIRNDQLDMHIKMRSNNMVLTVAYDVFNFTMLQEYLYRSLLPTYPTLKMGKLCQSITSAHFFDKEQELVNSIIAADGSVAMPMKIQKPAEQNVKTSKK